ncbi:hypothetical protein [Fibrella forsythiae]|uniref:Glycosyl transferase n=1 Tax=Fibrella forsythiae TaxID=2817061 RepID=A0ABS3JGY3_9BACT|nr:hypothetical protein [Fibrella forsythiae]MBO0949267.1 hypothetical protein [Fibrella forsythiae]
MDKVVFSIVAKNYIPMANALGDSLVKVHPDVTFFIIVADADGDTLNSEPQRYTFVPAIALGVDRLKEMAFKYNVTEFCTALKPFAFAYFFQKGAQQVIYFDPDIYIFTKLNGIFDQLSHSSLVVTPHICTMEQSYTGLVPEGMLMHVGIFNFGFCAIANTKNGRRVVEWWQRRLVDQCYADKIDGLHTDQKWMDFIPSLIEDLHIERGLGYNMAIWNWHEREIVNRQGTFWVINRIDGTGLMPLVFFHFSNFNFTLAANAEQFRPKYIQPFPDLYSVSDCYAERLAKEAMGQYRESYSYSYAAFQDGTSISQFHRRLFRRLIESGYTFDDPFSAQRKGSFYALLKGNNLLSKPTQQIAGKSNEENYKDFEEKLVYLQKIAHFIKQVIGIDRYALLCKFAQRFVRPENQTFLIAEIGSSIPFYNENRYINWEHLLDQREGQGK